MDHLLSNRARDICRKSHPEVRSRLNFGMRFSTYISISKIENTIFFEQLSVYKKTMFRIQHVAITIPTTVRLLVKFANEIPKIIAWRNAVVKHVEQF